MNNKVVGFFFLSNFNNGKKLFKKINTKDILLKKKPLSGKFKKCILLKRFNKFKLYFFLSSKKKFHSPNKLIIDDCIFLLEYLFNDKAELITALGVAIFDINGAQ